MYREKTLEVIKAKEYVEQYPVELQIGIPHGKSNTYRNSKLIISASNEGGYNGTEVDLVQVLKWAESKGFCTVDTAAINKYKRQMYSHHLKDN